MYFCFAENARGTGRQAAPDYPPRFPPHTNKRNYMNTTNLIEITIPEQKIVEAAAEGMDAFVRTFSDAISEAAGGTLNAEAMQRLNADQITLWGYTLLHDELMDGGFIQMIHNGYGPFFFKNPFAKAMRLWGLHDFSKLIYKAQKLYTECGTEIERDCTDEDFMALFERFPRFDDLDDTFVEEEENIQAAVARYIDEHIENFATIVK